MLNEPDTRISTSRAHEVRWEALGSPTGEDELAVNLDTKHSMDSAGANYGVDSSSSRPSENEIFTIYLHSCIFSGKRD